MAEAQDIEKLLPGESKRTQPREGGSVTFQPDGKKIKKAKPKPPIEEETGGER